MAPPTLDGEIELTLESYDAIPNLTLVMSVTGISTEDTELDLAKKIFNQVNTIITQTGNLFQGTPLYITSDLVSTFRPTRTDTVIDFFSQTQFDLVLTGNTCGAKFNILNNPTFLTVAEAKAFGAIYGQDFLDDDGNTMTDDSIALLMGMVSGTVSTLMRNPVIACTHVHECVGNNTESIELAYKPILKMDLPFVRRFTTYAMIEEPEQDLMAKYFPTSENGYVFYRYAQNIIQDDGDPYARGNNIRFSYIAGWKSIPTELKAAIVKISTIADEDQEINQLKGGTFSVNLSSDTAKVFSLYLSGLTKYML